MECVTALLSKDGDSFYSLDLQTSEQAQQVSDGHLRGLGHDLDLGDFLWIEGDAPSGRSDADQRMSSWRHMTPQI